MRSLVPPAIVAGLGAALVIAGLRSESLAQAHIPWSMIIFSGLAASWTVVTVVVMPLVAGPRPVATRTGRLTRPARTPHSPGAAAGTGPALVRDVAHRGGATPRFAPGRASVVPQ